MHKKLYILSEIELCENRGYVIITKENLTREGQIMKKILIISLLSLTIGTIGVIAFVNRGNATKDAIAQATEQTYDQATEQTLEITVAENATNEQVTEETKKKTTEIDATSTAETSTAPVATEESPEKTSEKKNEKEIATDTTTESAPEKTIEGTKTPSPESTPTAPESTPETDVPEATTVSTSEGGPDKYGHTWYEKNTWTASNGYVLKICDQAALVLTSPDAIRSGDDIYLDGTEDYSPNSAWNFAAVEWTYSNEKGFKGGTDRYNPEVVDVSLLPYVSTVSSKQTSLTATSEWNAYKEVFDPMHSFQATGIWEFNPVTMLHLTDDFIGLASSDGVGYLWEISYQGDCWKVTFRNNPSELSWHGFHTALKMITPDADAIYNEVYKQMYGDNPTFPEYDMWVTIGDSQVMVSVGSYAYVYFK